jgi:hypothetical protein
MDGCTFESLPHEFPVERRVDRTVASDSTNDLCLVKWKDGSYEGATWEHPINGACLMSVFRRRGQSQSRILRPLANGFHDSGTDPGGLPFPPARMAPNYDRGHFHHAARSGWAS